MRWTHDYFTFLYTLDWELTKSPAGAWQWKPTGESAKEIVPDAHVAPGNVRRPCAPPLVEEHAASIERHPPVAGLGDSAHAVVNAVTIEEFVDDPEAEESGKALVEPQVTPIRGGHEVSEPLVGDFVCNHLANPLLARP